VKRVLSKDGTAVEYDRQGTATWPWVRQGLSMLAAALPRAKRHSLEGQSHDVARRPLSRRLRSSFYEIPHNAPAG